MRELFVRKLQKMIMIWKFDVFAPLPSEKKEMAFSMGRRQTIRHFHFYTTYAPQLQESIPVFLHFDFPFIP